MSRPDEPDNAIHKVLWVMGIAVALVAGVGVWSASSARVPADEDPCVDADNVMRELWTEEAALDLSTRVESLDPELDADAIARGFGKYFDRWQWTRTDLCRRAAAEGRPFDQQTPGGRCLQRRTEQFAAAVDLVRDGDPDIAREAPRFVAALEDPAPCLDEHHTRYDLPMPPNPTGLVPALVVQQRLAEIEMLLAGGLHERALERIDDISDAVTEAGHLPSMAEYELLRFTALPAEARRHPAEIMRMTEAIGVSDRAGADPIAARLLVLQLATLGHHHPQRSMVEVLAEARVIRSGDSVAAEALDRWRARQGAAPPSTQARATSVSD
jgi:hypothetical protein